MDNQYYEMPKWSTWEIETWRKKDSADFEMYRQFKWATLNTDELEYISRDKDFDESLFKLFPTCPKETGFYICIFCSIDSGCDIYNFPSCEDEEILKEYEKLVKEEDWLDVLEDMEYEQEESATYFQLKRTGDFSFDITKDFEKYFEENAK